MIWRRGRSGRPREHAVTPADVADLAAAKEARARVERQIETGRSRWPAVMSIKAKLREIREENHLADDLHVIFTHHHQRG